MFNINQSEVVQTQICVKFGPQPGQLGNTDFYQFEFPKWAPIMDE